MAVLVALMGLLLIVVVFFVKRLAAVGADRRVTFITTGPAGGLTREELYSLVLSPTFLSVLVGWILVHFILRVPSYIVLYTADIGVGQAVGALVLTLVGVLITEVCLGIGPALRPYRSHDYVSLVQFFAAGSRGKYDSIIATVCRCRVWRWLRGV